MTKKNSNKHGAATCCLRAKTRAVLVASTRWQVQPVRAHFLTPIIVLAYFTPDIDCLD